MSLISLVYVSYAAHPMTDDELRTLLEECRSNNQRLQVTGMLLYRQGFFIQDLEGEESVILPLFEAIAKDTRHRNVIKIHQRELITRSFPNWSMGFNKLGDGATLPMEGFTDFLQQPNTEYLLHDPDRARVMLESFKEGIYF